MSQDIARRLLQGFEPARPRAHAASETQRSTAHSRGAGRSLHQSASAGGCRGRTCCQWHVATTSSRSTRTSGRRPDSCPDPQAASQSSCSRGSLSGCCSGRYFASGSSLSLRSKRSRSASSRLS